MAIGGGTNSSSSWQQYLGNNLITTASATFNPIHFWNEEQLHPRSLSPREWLEQELYSVRKKAWA